MDDQDHNELIRKQFSKQACTCGEAPNQLSDPELLAWVMSNLDLTTDSDILDVAA